MLYMHQMKLLICCQFFKNCKARSQFYLMTMGCRVVTQEVSMNQECVLATGMLDSGVHILNSGNKVVYSVASKNFTNLWYRLGHLNCFAMKLLQNGMVFIVNCERDKYE